MAISGNPLTLARDIGDGYQSLSPTALKKFTPMEMKTVNASLQKVLREVRGEVPPPGDTEAIRRKNFRMQRLNQAIVMLTNYCRQHRIPL